jgi:hypothetical protein
VFIYAGSFPEDCFSILAAVCEVFGSVGVDDTTSIHIDNMDTIVILTTIS